MTDSQPKYDANNSLLINANRQISQELDQNNLNDDAISENPNLSNSHSESPRFNYHSTLRKNQQSWVDPLEPRIQDTFYHKNLDTLRPRYSLLLKVPFIHSFIHSIFPILSEFSS